ncbi:MAG: type II toxin-antitoxin system VapC family toxin [Phycisphaerae bacterium]|nr:type II toxin-antitoxin system VapC family toxin [Phycisphaerae bacterium]
MFDTDIIIWALCGRTWAQQLLVSADHREISTATWLELLEGARDKREHASLRTMLADLDMRVVPLSEAIGIRAAAYLERYALSNGLDAMDAVIAATAAEHGSVLVTGNAKHFKAITDLQIEQHTDG